MVGDRVTVYLNGELVADNVAMENYWDRKLPIFPKGAIELQVYVTNLVFIYLYVCEINNKEINLTNKEIPTVFRRFSMTKIWMSGLVIKLIVWLKMEKL